MIDRALGLDQPAPSRRRKPDTASETSSKKESSVKEISEPVLVKPSPARSFTKKSTQQQPQEEVQVQIQPVQQVVKTNKPRKETKPEKSDKKQSSDEEIASPAVRNLGFAKVAKSPEQMRGSLKLTLKQSVREIQTQKSDDTMYKLKLLAFIVISFLMIIYAMTPARKGQRRK